MSIVASLVTAVAQVAPTLPTTAPTTMPAAEGSIVTQLVMAAALLAFGLGLAAALGVFRRNSVRGPERLLDSNDAGRAMIGLLVGLGVWLGAQYVLLTLAEEGMTAAQRVSVAGSLSPLQFGVLGVLPGVAGAIAMVACDLVGSGTLLDRLGLSAKSIPRGLRDGGVAFVGTMPILFGTLLVLESLYQVMGLQHPDAHELLIEMKTAGPLAKGLLTAAAIVVAPLFEEMLFRGHLQSFLQRYVGPWFAIAISAALFASVHELWSVPAIFVLAVILGYAYERTGNLWTTITIHALFNAFQTAWFLLG